MGLKPGNSKRRTPPQPVLPGLKFSSRLSFGGSLLDGRRKEARFFDPKRALHVVMRSSRATGTRSLLRFKRRIAALLSRQAELHGVKIYSQANVGNHLHLVLRAFTRRSLRNFLRSVSGLIARCVLGLERGPAKRAEVSSSPLRTPPGGNKGRAPRTADDGTGVKRAQNPSRHDTGFWDARPFSRVVAWGKSFAALKRYVHLNRVEALGFTRPEARSLLAVCRELGLDPPLA